LKKDLLSQLYILLAITLSCVLADEQETLMIEAPHPKELLLHKGCSKNKFSFTIKKRIGAPTRTLEHIEDLELYLKKNWDYIKKLEGYILRAFEYDTCFLITLERGNKQ